MNKNKQLILLAVAVGIALIALGAFAYSRGALSLVSGFPKINWALLQHPRPVADKEVVFPEAFTEEQKSMYLSNLEKITSLIVAEPENDTAWNDLAIYRKMVGDYEGAKAIWHYQIALRPQNFIALHNLAELYFHYLKDYAKAEKLYFRAIGVAPNVAINYTDLLEMYRYAYKQDTNAIVDIVDRGFASLDVRSQADLQVMLADYYREKGDRERAKQEFLEAADLADQADQKERAARLRAEAAKL